MSGPLDFTNENIENTYQRVLQTDGVSVYDGTGSLFVITTDTGSLLVTASAALNQVTFTKGDTSQFTIIIDTGSATPIDTSSFVTTSSFNNFTSSYNTGSFTGSFSGSFYGTASWAGSSSQAISASYALSSSYSLSSSFATTASWAANGGVTQLLAGPNILISPTTGLGQVTISSTGGGGGTGNTATGSYGSFYSTVTQTNVAGTARSMSLNVTDISNGVSISGSTNPFNTYIKTENPGIYDIQFSAQVDKTDSGTDEIWIWLRKNGIDISDSATSLQLVGNGAHYVAAWNFFVNAAANDYFQLMWYSPDANVRLHAEAGFGIVPGIPSLIVTVNRVDQFLSNTGSFTGSFTGELIGTASWAYSASEALIAQTASFITASNVYGPYGSNSTLSASHALSSSYSISSSYALTSSYALSSSYADLSISASYAFTASYVLQAVSSSFASTAITQPAGTNNTSSATTAFVMQAVSRPLAASNLFNYYNFI